MYVILGAVGEFRVRILEAYVVHITQLFLLISFYTVLFKEAAKHTFSLCSKAILTKPVMLFTKRRL